MRPPEPFPGYLCSLLFASRPLLLVRRFVWTQRRSGCVSCQSPPLTLNPLPRRSDGMAALCCPSSVRNWASGIAASMISTSNRTILGAPISPAIRLKAPLFWLLYDLSELHIWSFAYMAMSRFSRIRCRPGKYPRIWGFSDLGAVVEARSILAVGWLRCSRMRSFSVVKVVSKKVSTSFALRWPFRRIRCPVASMYVGFLLPLFVCRKQY